MTTPDTPALRSGGYSIAGYDYQIEVSIWLALDLVLAGRVTQAVTIEPASEEDLEADVAPDAPGRLTSTTGIASYRLIVQAKRRSRDAWTVAGLKALLAHGTGRMSARQRLVDPMCRYLLVTSAALNGPAADLGVLRPDSWPAREQMPPSLGADYAAGRVAVIERKDEKALATDIKELLTEAFRVPRLRLAECVNRLRQEARLRMLGAGDGRWTRDQLEAVIKAHEGYFASSPELDRYVYPTNWQQLRKQVQRHHAVLIVGQSGSGKTMAVRKLIEELRGEVPGLARVHISQDPRQLHEDQTSSPVVFDIEDPWGKYAFDPDRRAWSDQLEKVLAQARHDRIVIVTTRHDVAKAANALHAVKDWIVPLEAEQYGPRERRLIYRGQLEELGRELQHIAKGAEKAVLAQLATPLEIRKFFDALRRSDDEWNNRPGALVDEAIRRAHQDAIERSVAMQIEARDDVWSATVVWALLKADDRFSSELLRRIEEALADVDSQYRRGVRPLVLALVAGRNLRLVDGLHSYYHPRVEAGVEQALAANESEARHTLKRLIDVLVLQPLVDTGKAELMAARILQAAERVLNGRLSLGAAAQGAIDVWLQSRLPRDAALEEHIRLAGSAGSRSSGVAEAARYLLSRPDRTFPGFDVWGAPDHDEDWYRRMRDDPAVAALIESFIVDILPDSRDSFDEDFAIDVARLAPDVTAAFLRAATRAVSYGYTRTGAAIAWGALRNEAAFESVVDEAVIVLTPSPKDAERADGLHLDIANEVYSLDYEEHLTSRDDGYMAREFLGGYVAHLRQKVQWRSISQHRHARHLLPYWLRALSDDEDPDEQEVAAALELGYGHEDEWRLWSAVSKVGPARYRSALERRVADGHRELWIRQSALRCLALHAPEAVAQIVGALLRAGLDARAVEVAEDIGQSRADLSRPRDETLPEPTQQQRDETIALGNALDRVVQLLEPNMAQVSRLAESLHSGAAPHLEASTLQWLSSIEQPGEAVSWFRLRAARHLDLFSPNDVRELLATSDVVERCVGALEAAIRHEMIPEINAGLTHRFAHVVALSLQHIGKSHPVPLPETLLALGHARGSPVRLALAQLLQERLHEAHRPILLELAADNWSREETYRDEDEYHPIAQAAVAALSRMGRVNDATAAALYGVAVSSRDSTVRAMIFTHLVRLAPTDWQSKLLDLALNPGTAAVRLAAACVLALEHACVGAAVTERISPDLVATKIQGVAAWLVALAAVQRSADQLQPMAQELAARPKRRVFVLLMIWLLNEQDPVGAARFADMLGKDHAAVQWSLAGAKQEIEDVKLADLGDVPSVTHVLSIMRSKCGTLPWFPRRP